MLLELSLKRRILKRKRNSDKQCIDNNNNKKSEYDLIYETFGKTFLKISSTYKLKIYHKIPSLQVKTKLS